MKVSKYLKKELKYYNRIKENRQAISNFIEGQNERLQDLTTEGLSEKEANDKLLAKLSDLSEFKSSLKPYTAAHQAYSNFIYSIGGFLIITLIIIILVLILKVNLMYALIPIIATLFWPLSMWNNYYKKL